MTDVAVSAGNSFRAIDALVDDLKSIPTDSPRSLGLIERFVQLHREFYRDIIILMAEESWEVDTEFREQVEEEEQRLREVVQYIKKERWFLGELVGNATWKLDKLSDYFAQCVDDIFEWYGVDDKTNEIYWVYE